MDERELRCPGLGRLQLPPREVQTDDHRALRREGGTPLGSTATQFEEARRPTVGPRAPSSLSGTDHAPHSFGWRPIWGSWISWYHELIWSQTRRLALAGSQSTVPSSSSPS